MSRLRFKPLEVMETVLSPVICCDVVQVMVGVGLGLLCDEAMSLLIFGKRFGCRLCV